MNLSEQIKFDVINGVIKAKKTSHEPRRNREFSRRTKKDCFDKASGKCESCKISLSPHTAHYHHRIPLALAFYYYPGQFPDVYLKSIENCQILCDECHKQFHNNDSIIFYSSIAQNLLEMLKNWQPKKHEPKTTRNEKKKIRKQMQENEIERRKKLGVKYIDYRQNN